MTAMPNLGDILDEPATALDIELRKQVEQRQQEFTALVMRDSKDTESLDREAVALIRRFLRSELVAVLKVPLEIALNPNATDRDRLAAFDALARYGIGTVVDKNLTVSSEKKGVVALPMLETDAVVVDTPATDPAAPPSRTDEVQPQAAGAAA